MVLKLSLNAQKSFDDYLNQVKAYLKGVKSVDADEIQQQITEHIENELAGSAEPVSSETLDEVLKKLGSPQQWVPEEELPWWKKFALRVRTGPEDWRLAYISFGLLLLGFLLPPAFLLLVPASYLVSRAALSFSNYDLQVKAQKWLLYPSLLIVYTSLLLLLLSWPLILILTFWAPKYSGTLHELGVKSVDTVFIIVTTVVSMASLGVIWTGYGLILLSQKRQHLIRTIFKPFGNRFNRKWVLVFIFIGIAFFALSIVAAFIINYFELIPAGLLPNQLFF